MYGPFVWIETTVWVISQPTSPNPDLKAFVLTLDQTTTTTTSYIFEGSSHLDMLLSYMPHIQGGMELRRPWQGGLA